MEFIQDLLATAFVALLFSFFVAKLVSVALSGADDRRVGSKSSESTPADGIVEEVKFGGLRVQSVESKRRVQYIDEVFQKVDELEGERSVDKLEKSFYEEDLEEKRCDSEVVCEAACRIEARDVSVVRLSERSSGDLTEEKAAVGGIDEVEVSKEEVIVRKLDELDRFWGENKVTGLVVEENTIANVTANDHVVVSSVTGDVAAHVPIDCDDEGGENPQSGIGERLHQGEKEELVGDEEDDWEGIEKTELEKVFTAASNYVADRGKDDQFSNLGSDVQMQLYGLHKVAMEGPCHEPQPIAFKVSARAKWNAWQRMGNMSPELAMEQYVTLLSDKIPGWMEGNSSGAGNAVSLESGTYGALCPDISTYADNEHTCSKDSKELEVQFDIHGGNLSGGSNSVNNCKSIRAYSFATDLE